jgi:hypothetical protein
MAFNKIIQPSVGADLSRLPLSAPGSGVADLSVLGGCFGIRISLLNAIIGPRGCFGIRISLLNVIIGDNRHQPKWPHNVTLSEAKGLAGAPDGHANRPLHCAEAR